MTGLDGFVSLTLFLRRGGEGGGLSSADVLHVGRMARSTFFLGKTVAPLVSSLWLVV